MPTPEFVVLRSSADLEVALQAAEPTWTACDQTVSSTLLVVGAANVTDRAAMYAAFERTAEAQGGRLDVVFANAGIDASNLDIYLRRLREKLAPVLVENVRGLGYRIGLR